MKVVVLVLYTENWQSLADVTIPNTQRYCDKHGYRISTGTDSWMKWRT